ncbi:MAG TPA: hypothetical protein VNI60_09370 [Pyrinomonadaceae bacterium]|nr:hypothetical protein [Pyrinomonadaceae bacterium]
MEVDDKNSEQSREVLEKDKKEKFLVIIFCVVAAIVLDFYKEKHFHPSLIIQMFKIIGGASALFIPSIILTLFTVYLTRYKWHYVFAVYFFIFVILTFLGSRY